LEHGPSHFSVGWSHGKEALSEGKADVHKGSFYANPTTDAPAEEDPTVTEEDVARYPGYYHPNVWPTAAGDDGGSGSASNGGTHKTNTPNPNSSLPELEPAFKSLGRIVVDTGLLLAERCDAYVRRAWERRYGPQSAPPSSLAEALRASRCHKARLLHYFPPGAGAGVVAATAAAAAAAGGAATTTPTTTTPAAADDTDDADGWCGWHRDHGALTGLTCAMYTRPSTTRAPRLSCADDAHGVAAFGGGKEEEEEEEPPIINPSPRPASPPDARAGLYVRTRSGRAARADIPADHLAFQVGQVAAIVSGGLLCATPHCVRAPCAGATAGSDVSRETFAVFLQPDVRAPLSVPCPPAAAEEADAGQEAPAAPSSSLPRALTALLLSTADSGQYRPGDSFGDFAERTVRGNYGGGGGEGEGKAVGGGGGLQLGARAGADGDDAANHQLDSPSAAGRRRQEPSAAAVPAAVYVVHE
jgi:hypothetical protein